MIKKLPSVAYALFAFGCAFLQRPLQADPINRKGTPFPNQNLTKIYQGQDISTALGSNKHSVADWYGQTDSGFDDLCKRDRSMRADKQGRLHYVCAAPSVQQGSSSAWGYTGTTLAAPYADSQTFLLHSKPGATKVIYLCFTGFTTGGTAWNASYTSGANIVTPPYDIDGNPSAFSTTELANIQNIWLSVAEDYAPFDVDVTTQDPGVEALRKTSTTDAYYGIRVCIGGSSLDWYGYTAGGVAYLNSFDWDTDTPAFVFPAQLGTGNPKFVAEAAAHEAGHTLGLHHDGLTASSPSGAVEYFTGQGVWAPIMGSSYTATVGQWCKGEYQYANNTEDQIALISSYLPFRADLVGNTTASATTLAGNTFTTSGILEQTGEVDVFSFTTGAGNVSLTAKSATVNGNVNLLLSLYNSSGTAISTAGPTTASTGATISTNLAAGTYYLAVNGVGSLNALTTGYSNYGCIGQYSVTGNVVPANNKAPTAVASGTPTTGTIPLAVTFSSTGSADSDGSISSYSWNFGDGSTSASAAPSHSYTAAGTYTATLTVYDNYGVASTPVSVTITAKANAAPTAKAAATPTTGTAPLAVTFSSTGSADTDGTVASYSWNFGDGTTSTAAAPSHTYTTAGSYTATLTVKDNLGLASTAATVLITVNPAPYVYIAGLSVTKTKGTKGTYATVTATVKDQTGALKSGATVAGSWSGGLVSGTASGKTGTAGTIALSSSATTKTGTITFTVTGITLSGYTYTSSKNTTSAISIAVP